MAAQLILLDWLNLSFLMPWKYTFHIIIEIFLNPQSKLDSNQEKHSL